MDEKTREDILKDVKPAEVSYSEKIKEDSTFLLALIEDPVKAFRTYGYNGDDKMMSMLQGMSRNIRVRAIKVFSEITNIAEAGQACDACNGCRACKACLELSQIADIIRT